MYGSTRTPARTVQLIAAIGLALVAAACGGATEASSPAPSPTPSSTATGTTANSAPRRALTPQGFITKDIGQLAGVDCTSDLDSCAIKFTIDKIEVDPQCEQYGTAAAVGRKTLLLHVSMTTGNLSENGSTLAPTIFNPFSLKGIGEDGFVHEAQPGTCTAHDVRLSNTILPNARYAGTVEVEVAESSASIASAYPVASDGSRGWVWKIG